MFSANICIIESQSFHPLHKMDKAWLNQSIGLGHDAAIFPQTQLDNISSLEGFDCIVISSALIELSDERNATILQFVQEGGNVYVQSEYMGSLPGNATFDYLINALGGSFEWGEGLTGNLAPVSITGELTNNLNILNSIDYFWYGTPGTGDENINILLENQNYPLAFLYCSPEITNGRIITASDQDWIRILSTQTQIDLLQNFITALAQSTSIDLPEVNINASTSSICPGDEITFTANSSDDLSNATFQWNVNGIELENETNLTLQNNQIQIGDFVSFTTRISATCADVEIVSNIINITANELLIPTATIASSQNEICQGEEIIFTASGENLGTAPIFQWKLNGNNVGNNSATFSTSTLLDGQVISCTIISNETCISTIEAITSPITVSVNQALSPAISIEGNIEDVCSGGDANFIAIGYDFGMNPSFQWFLDGQVVGNNSSELILSDLELGQIVTCELNITETCATMNTVESEPFLINLAPLASAEINITSNVNSICEGEEVTFNAEGTNLGDNPTFQWKINNTNTGINSPTFTTNQLQEGQEVSCQVISSMDCLSSNIAISEVIEIAYNTLVIPTALVLASATFVCPNETILFETTGTNLGNNPTYQWTIDGVEVGDGLSAFATSQLQNGQIVRCLVTSNSPCASNEAVNSNPITVTVGNLSLSVVNIENEHCNSEDGLARVKAIGGTTPYAYRWDSGLISDVLIDVTEGIYAVTVTDAIGCTAIQQIVIHSEKSPEILSVITENLGCNNDEGSAKLDLKNQDEYLSYIWTKTNGEVISTEPIAKNLEEGVYNVEIINEFGCSDISSFEIIRNNLVHVAVYDDATIEKNETIQIVAKTVSETEVSFEWFPIEGLSCTDCAEPIASPSTTTTYTLTVTNKFGCTATGDVTITVIGSEDEEEELGFFIPNAFSPNGDGVNDFFNIYGGSEVAQVKTLKIYDRWGTLLFDKSDFSAFSEQEGWNGVYKGQVLSTGVFIFFTEVEFIDGSTKTFKGDISVIN